MSPRVVDWLWDGRLAYGKLNVLGGPPGVGKTYLTGAVAAAVSNGDRLPGDLRPATAAGHALMVSYEDDPEDTLRPRLDLLGAKLDRVTFVEGVEGEHGRVRSFGVEDVALLDAYCDTVPDVQLITIDPVAGYVGGGTDDHRGNEVRAALEELRTLAQRRGLCVLLVMHTRKSAATSALNRLSGSGAYGQLVRSAVMAGPIPDDPSGRHALAHVKHNLGPKQPTLAYSVDGDGLTWRGEVDLDAEAIANEGDPDARTAGDEAEGFLRTLLADGPVRAAEGQSQAEEVGVASRTLKRAKKRLGVESRKRADGWWWVLPANLATTSPTRETWRGGEVGDERAAPCAVDDCDQPSSATDTAGIDWCASHAPWNRTDAA